MNRYMYFFVSILLGLPSSFALAQLSEPREWSDSTGGHKITATFVELKEGNVYLKTPQGKTIKIPVARLSPADQELVKGGDNPFQEVEGDDTKMPSGKSAGESTAAESSNGGASGWNSPLKIDWEDVEELDRSFDGEWKLELPKQSELGFTAKRATLNKKNNFHEDIRRLEVNPIAQRAVVGYTVSFSLPKPQSRLALIDLVSGKTIHTAPVEADMCPMCLLNDGSTVLMYGTSDDRKGFETSDQIQLWRVNGKKIIQSKTWIPFPDEAESWGKRTNGNLAYAVAIPNNKLIMVSGNGHLACIDVVTRKPYWHAKLSDNFAIDASTDRSLLAIADGHAIMIVDPQTGTVKASTFLEDKPHIGWPRIRWSPGGTKLLYAFMSEIRVLDLTSGNWVHQVGFTGGPIAPNALSYPHDDYALLDNHLLVHIPSQIKVCDYRSATRITSVGGMCFIGMQGGDGGLVVPAKMPHPAAEKILAQAEKDPSVFLVHPGVQVAVNAAGAGQWAGQVAQMLSKAATASGYKVVANAPIVIEASVSGPKQEAVSYIASGSYIANVYQSTVKITWQGKDLWSAGGSNVPGMISTGRGESIQDKLNELGKTPNLGVFENAKFPKMLQKPSIENKGPGAQSDALMTSNFTMQGLVDSK
ncbi:MAG: SHD1 domain-containing protein [Pirellulaceae bacterium]|nr:SHD1 domain-containing protein [Pirellulaceae bacterium]